MPPAQVATVAIVATVLWYGWLKPGDASKADIEIITSSTTVERYLVPFKEQLGHDYDGYRNHVYRTLSYALHHLGGTHAAKRKQIEEALVYHDLGLWTDDDLAYLEPSWARAERDLRSKLSEEDLQLVRDIIRYHHKFTPFSRGKHADVVDAVRKADWCDSTHGLVSKGMSSDNIAKAFAELPERGFYSILARFGPRLRGYNVPLMGYEIAQIFYV